MVVLLPAALLAATTTASLAEPVGLEPARGGWSEGRLAVAVLERNVSVARRRRRWRGSLGIGLGSLQVGMGAYGLASARFNSVMKRTAFAQLLLGASTVGLGIYALGWPRPSEKLWASDERGVLVEAPDDPEALSQFRQRWAERARKAQLMRYVMGGGYIAGGLALTTVGTVLHFHRSDERSDIETFWSYTTIGTGVGLVLTGALQVTIHSQIEETYETLAHVFGWRSYRGTPPRGARVRVTPTWGGALIHGHF